MIRLLWLEFFKNKRRKFFIGLIVLIIVQMLWLFITMKKVQLMGVKTFNFDINYLLVMLSLLNATFGPIIISIFSVKVLEVDKQNRMISILKINFEDYKLLYNIKILYGIIIIMLYVLFQMMEAFIMIKYFNITNNLFLFMQEFLGLTIGMISVYIIFISLTFLMNKTNLIICLGLLSSFISLMTASLLPSNMIRVIPTMYLSIVNPLQITNSKIILNSNFMSNLFFISTITFIVWIISEKLIIRKKLV